MSPIAIALTFWVGPSEPGADTKVAPETPDACAELEESASQLLVRDPDEQTRRFAKRLLRKRKKLCPATTGDSELCRQLNQKATEAAGRDQKLWQKLANQCREADPPDPPAEPALDADDADLATLLKACDDLGEAAAASGDPDGFLREQRRCRRLAANMQLGKRIDAEKGTFRGALADARRARCATAICWGPSNKWAFEPLVELPIGKSVALPTSGSLAAYVNSSTVDVQVSAGIRFWLWWDWVSIGMYLSRPLIDGADTVPVKRTGFMFPKSQIRRPLPGLGLGFFGDVLWVGVDYDQLRNGQTPETMSDQFPANEVVSHAVVFSFAIAPFAGIRNGLGTLTERKRKKEEADEAAKKDGAKKADETKQEVAGDDAKPKKKSAAGKKAVDEGDAAGVQPEEGAGDPIEAPPPENPPEPPESPLIDQVRDGIVGLFGR